jgi:hypothetical protein
MIIAIHFIDVILTMLEIQCKYIRDSFFIFLYTPLCVKVISSRTSLMLRLLLKKENTHALPLAHLHRIGKYFHQKPPKMTHKRQIQMNASDEGDIQNECP